MYVADIQEKQITKFKLVNKIFYSVIITVSVIAVKCRHCGRAVNGLPCKPCTLPSVSESAILNSPGKAGVK